MTARPAAAVIDDLSQHFPLTPGGARWEVITDGVMGGVSDGGLAPATILGRPAIRMTGQVRLENNGGFVQIALDLSPDGTARDASGWTGLAITVAGPPETYNLHLRTADIRRPWQSYRHSVTTTPDWQTHRLPFAGFVPHRIDAPLDLRTLRRVGIVAIGRAFQADLALADLRFYG